MNFLPSAFFFFLFELYRSQLQNPVICAEIESSEIDVTELKLLVQIYSPSGDESLFFSPLLISNCIYDFKVQWTIVYLVVFTLPWVLSVGMMSS